MFCICMVMMQFYCWMKCKWNVLFWFLKIRGMTLLEKYTQLYRGVTERRFFPHKLYLITWWYLVWISPVTHFYFHLIDNNQTVYCSLLTYQSCVKLLLMRTQHVLLLLLHSKAFNQILSCSSVVFLLLKNCLYQTTLADASNNSVNKSTRTEILKITSLKYPNKQRLWILKKW